MNIQAIKERVVERLGAIEERCFERISHGMPRLLYPFFEALLLVLLGRDIYDHVVLSEQALILEEALVRSRAESTRKSLTLVDNNKARDKVDPLPDSGISGAGTLEVINRIALIHGIELDEVRSGGTCDSDDSISRRQIQIVFRSSFSQLREFNRSLNNEVTKLLTESLLIERDSSSNPRRATTGKICVSVVTKTS